MKGLEVKGAAWSKSRKQKKCLPWPHLVLVHIPFPHSGSHLDLTLSSLSLRPFLLEMTSPDSYGFRSFLPITYAQ